MNIIVCIKQVPDAKELKINPITGNLIREGVPAVINPDDKHAVEAALNIREQCGDTKVTVLTMGPLQAAEALRECLAMGADEAILLSDKAFSGADTWATSYTLGCAVRKIGHFDLILCGRQATDGNTAQVGPQIAEMLGLPQVTYVQGIEVYGKTLKITRALEDSYEMVEIRPPALLTVIKDINIPRIPAIDAITESFQEEIVTWTVKDLDLDKSKIGLKGSPTRIKKAYTPNLKKGQVEILGRSLDEAVQALIYRLSAKGLIKEG